MPRSSHFQDIWLSDDSYKGWVRKTNSDTEVKCNYCQNTFSIENMGEGALKSHAKGKKHKSRSPVTSGSLAQVVQSSQSSSSSQSSTSSSSADDPSSSKKSSQSRIDDSFSKENVMHAEMRWALHVIESRASQRSCDGMSDLFATMFPTSVIAENFQLARGKCGYVINHGFAPYVRQCLLDQLGESPFFAMSFDESLNKSQQKGQMDILVRYWNALKNIVETRYYTSEFLGGAKAEKILKSFEHSCSKLDDSKLVHIGSDGPNVNKKFLKQHIAKREFLELVPTLNIGTCGLHTVHGSLKTGIKAADWKVGKILKAMHGLLEDVPARRENYTNVTETDVFPMSYCGHRWCENEKACNRADTIWQSYTKFIKFCSSQPKSNQPKGKRWVCLVEALKDPLIRAKFKLVELIAAKLNVYLRGFQSDQPMIPFMFNILKEIVESILRMFILRDVIQDADSLQKLIALDLTDVNIRRKSPDVGTGAKLHVQSYRSSKKFNVDILNKFYKECGTFFSGLVSHMLEKSPLRHQIIRCASCFDPRSFAVRDKQESCLLKFTVLVEKLASVGRISVSVADRAKDQYRRFIEDAVPRQYQEFTDFDIFGSRLDSLLHPILCQDKYKDVWLVCQIVFIMFHGQSHIERGFKTNKEFMTTNQNEASLISLRIVHDHMQANELTAATFPLSFDLVKHVRAARSRYEVEQREKRAKKELNAKDLKRKIVSEELDEIRKKKACYVENIDYNIKEVDKVTKEAFEKSDLTLLSRVLDLKKINEEKKLLIAELEKMDAELVARRDSIL